MVHLDIKKVGRIPDGGGWRAHGRGSTAAKAVARAKTAGVQAGYVYLHSAVDGFSRLAYTEALPDETAATAIAFLRRARGFFATHGITHLERIVTDNGACYRAHDFATVLQGARHQRITPYTPRHNGKVERYNRTLAEEFLNARTWTSEQQRTDALEVWNVHYNYHRPHTDAGNTHRPHASTTASPTSRPHTTSATGGRHRQPRGCRPCPRLPTADPPGRPELRAVPVALAGPPVLPAHPAIRSARAWSAARR